MLLMLKGKLRLLTCGHLTHSGFSEPTIWCMRCKRTVEFVPEYEASCLTCRIHRSYGYDRHSANHMLTQHQTRYPMHTIRLRFGAEVLWTKLPSKLLL